MPARRAKSPKVTQLHGARSQPASVATILGRVVRIRDCGQPMVDFPGNSAGPLAASSWLPPEHPLCTGSEVLLVFERGDRMLPVILARAEASATDSTPDPGAPLIEEVTVRSRRLVLEGDEEVVVRCGQGSLTIRADGTVIIRGCKLLSRSSGVNRIKGAAVLIN